MMGSPLKKSMVLTGNERWFLVHSLPRGEWRAQLHLDRQGFRTHLPEISKTVRHARQFRTVRAPLFPRYLFIILDLKRDRWLSVQSTFGVSTLFTCGGRPVPVPVGIVEGLEHRHGLRAGQQVRMLSGPFAGFIGELERLDEGGRVSVLLKMMGAVVPIAVDRSTLLPAA
jgi:transcription elongation factor/antiterminator RfaH